MTLDLDAVEEELAGAGCLRPRTAAALLAEVERLRTRPCSHVRTADEGTSYCTLAEDAAAEVERLRAESVPRSALVQVVVDYWDVTYLDSGLHVPENTPVYLIREQA